MQQMQFMQQNFLQYQQASQRNPEQISQAKDDEAESKASEAKFPMAASIIAEAYSKSQQQLKPIEPKIERPDIDALAEMCKPKMTDDEILLARETKRLQMQAEVKRIWAQETTWVKRNSTCFMLYSKDVTP